MVLDCNTLLTETLPSTSSLEFTLPGTNEQEKEPEETSLLLDSNDIPAAQNSTTYDGVVDKVMDVWGEACSKEMVFERVRSVCEHIPESKARSLLLHIQKSWETEWTKIPSFAQQDETEAEHTWFENHGADAITCFSQDQDDQMKAISDTMPMTPRKTIFDTVMAIWGHAVDPSGGSEAMEQLCQKIHEDSLEQLLDHIRTEW